jgi:alpha-beta hydrolase superfamily lysophospholipase
MFVPFPRLLRRWRLWLMSLVLIAALAYAAIGYVAAGVLTIPERRFDAAVHPSAFGAQGTRDVTLTTRDGIEIAGWYLPVPGSDAAVVMVHGHESSRTWEFRGRFPELAAALQANGYQVVMIDLRGHGASAGERFSFGHLERFDVMAAVDLLLAEGVPAGQVGVLGVSMGGATAIGAAASDGRIGAVWSDSAYADILPILRLRWPAASGLPLPFLSGALAAHRLRFGFDLGGVRPELEIQSIAPRPIHLAHSTADATIPYPHALDLQRASGAELWTVAGVPHAGLYPDDPAGYTARVVDFFDVTLRMRLAAVR